MPDAITKFMKPDQYEGFLRGVGQARTVVADIRKGIAVGARTENVSNTDIIALTTGALLHDYPTWPKEAALLIAVSLVDSQSTEVPE